jgi:phosphate transport system substrate-binding protein
MKTIMIKAFALMLLISLSASAQKKEFNAFSLAGAKFMFPLIEKWVSEYNKTNPQIQININTKQNVDVAHTLKVVASHWSDSNLLARQTVFYVGRYALIPVSNKQNPILAKAGKSGLSKRVVKKLFFEESDEYGEEQQETKSKYNATVYARESLAQTSIALARYFDAKPSELKGRKILGDEIYLLYAIKKDTTGVAFNSLNYVYDIQTRKLKNDIALLPLNLKSQQREALNTLNIDNAIALLEKNEVENIPVDSFGFVVSNEQLENKNFTAFLRWVLTDGQKFNHETGFLNLDESTLIAQREQLNDKYLSAIQ